jgi:hypothetical protein
MKRLLRLDELHVQEWMSSLTDPMAVPREWDFINITDPKQGKDRRIQRLVRVKAQRHVRKCQKKEQEPKSASPDSSLKSEAANSPSYLGQLTLRDPGVPHCYPIQMKPYMQALLDRCQYAPILPSDTLPSMTRILLRHAGRITPFQ